ncbi:MAG: altronate dehydratase [Cellvibrionaceae bacterium]|jgi:altronate dehydratase
MKSLNLFDIGRLPSPSDNCAIATQTLAAGTQILHATASFVLSHTVLVGHRFAIQPLSAGEHLLSWGMPFGTALRAIEPGEYVCNAVVIEELAHHRLPFEIPEVANFSDNIPPFVFDKEHFLPADRLPRHADVPTFQGYKRAGGRGVGTRNTVVLLGINGTVSGFTRQLENHLKDAAVSFENVDEISAVVHTEGITADANNRELLLRTLAGFIVHSNVGGVLVIDNGVNGLTGEILRQYMVENNYPIEHVLHQFLSINGPFQEKLDHAAGIVTNWLPIVNKMGRTAEPISELKIALQCGGSDAFSGISGNPLISWVAKELIAYGGSANLAETDELVGAESYVLDRCRNEETAERFLATVDRFKQWAERHGHSAEGNPSGGNRYRGLYNIYLKSLGAATKRHPDVPLDYVIDYSSPMTEPGYYFMDSPGNDLESVAGQVAAGCNLIFFVTGNGSITNFPFVPTLKVVTTSERFALLSTDMDIDAGAYLSGKSLDLLGQETFKHFVETASGRLSVGEKAGHSQVQIWRNWPLGDNGNLNDVVPEQEYSGLPIRILQNGTDTPTAQWVTQAAVQKIGLILPTSLCSGQIAKMMANQLNKKYIRDHDDDGQYDRFTTLVHTEGCGSTTQPEFIATMLGYMDHPLVENCLLLEHGCEKTHNSYWRTQMDGAGLSLDNFGWASIQQDGGIEKSMSKIANWFEQQSSVEVSPTSLCLGLMTDGTAALDAMVVMALVPLIQQIVAAGGSVVLSEQDQLLQNSEFQQALCGDVGLRPTIPYAGRPKSAGLHIMAGQPSGWTELLVGLGAAGCDLFLSVSNGWPQNGHPLVPLVQAGVGQESAENGDWDVSLSEESDMGWHLQLSDLLASVRAGDFKTFVQQKNNIDFQITRGATGISM